MRVISLVPSLTETLIDCGVEVVGRTRFCIHPAALVNSISVVGGTKQVNWAACARLEPDLVVMDREENTREMAKSCPYPLFATHITSVERVSSQLVALNVRLQNSRLATLAADWEVLALAPELKLNGWAQLPGLVALINLTDKPITRIEYVIWRDPWMAVGAGTFIGSMLKKVGLGRLLADHAESYPELGPTDMARDDTFYLFSSEPYPFERFSDSLNSMGIQGAIVDGEFYSWFGARSYRELRRCLENDV